MRRCVGGLAARAVRRRCSSLAALGLAALVWEVYKAIGPGAGRRRLRLADHPEDQRPRDAARVGDARRVRSTRRSAAATRRCGSVLLGYSWFTLRMSLAGLALGAAIGVGAGRGDGAVPHRRTRPASVRRDLADDSADRARSAGDGDPRLARPAAVDLGRGARRVPLVLPGDRVDAARPAVGAGGVTRADGQLRRRMVDHAASSCGSRPRSRT